MNQSKQNQSWWDPSSSIHPSHPVKRRQKKHVFVFALGWCQQKWLKCRNGAQLTQRFMIDQEADIVISVSAMYEHVSYWSDRLEQLPVLKKVIMSPFASCTVCK